MFRRLIMFALLILVLAGGFVAPAQAQDDNAPIDMLENVVLSPDQTCISDACISIYLWEQCMNNPNSVPPLRANDYWLAEINRMSPFAIVGAPFLTGGAINANNDRLYYSFQQGAHNFREYRMHRSSKDGFGVFPPYENYSAWQYGTTGGLGTTLFFTTYHMNSNC